MASALTSKAPVFKAQGSSADVASTVQFKVNGVETKEVAVPAADPTGGQRLSSLRDAINDLSSQTGVTAEINDDGNIVLTDIDGDDIAISDFSSSTTGSSMTITTGDGAATEDLDGTTTSADIKGQVTMGSTQTFAIATTATGDAATETSFLAVDTNVQNFESSLDAVSEIDLTTAAGANSALEVIDTALSKISDARADLGAVSNRLDSVVSNLTNISTSVQAARSQVMDADFAQESTNLARGQILSTKSRIAVWLENSSGYHVKTLFEPEIENVLPYWQWKVAEYEKAKREAESNEAEGVDAMSSATPNASFDPRDYILPERNTEPFFMVVEVDEAGDANDDYSDQPSILYRVEIDNAYPSYFQVLEIVGYTQYDADADSWDAYFPDGRLSTALGLIDSALLTIER